MAFLDRVKQINKKINPISLLAGIGSRDKTTSAQSKLTVGQTPGGLIAPNIQSPTIPNLNTSLTPQGTIPLTPIASTATPPVSPTVQPIASQITAPSAPSAPVAPSPIQFDDQQLIGLNAAFQRQQGGTSNEEDDANLAYATARGFQPTPPVTAPGATPTGAPTQPEAPAAPVTTEAQKAVTAAEEITIESAKITPEELSTQKDLDDLIESTQKAFRGIQDQPIALEFITGQLSSVERRALGLAEPLEKKLSRLQAARTSSIEASKFALTRADKRLAAEEKKASDLSSPTTLGTGQVIVQFNPDTGEYETVASGPTGAESAEDFTLSENQIRFDAEGNVIARGGSVGDGQGGTISADAQNWANLINQGKAKLSDVPTDDLKNQVARINAQRPSEATLAQQRTQEQSDTAITNIDKVLEFISSGSVLSSGNTPFGRVIGQFLPGSEARDLNASLDTVKALIGFDALEKMRLASPTGGALGQVSERELSFLQSVAGSLDIGQSTSELQGTLNRIRSSFERMRAINSPDMSAEEYLEKFPDATDEELAEIIGKNTQESTSGGNRPQRNNNPGNVKSGGLADALAIGTDDQNHLIFATPEDGFKALQQDIAAKISGRSRSVPADPTIIEIGKVYAEDQGWANAVASILGIDPNTKAAQIDFDSLIEAIAIQEGFYA